MKTAVIHRTKLLVMAICLIVMLSIKGSTSAYSFEEDFFASEPQVTEIVDITRDIKYKGLVGKIRLSGDEGEGGRVKRAVSFYNGTAYVFLNIPYAQKLTPETVFELPKNLTDNSSMIERNKDETSYRHFGNYCPQESTPLVDERQLIYRNFCYSQMDIDCLNLNVFAPDLENEQPKTPAGLLTNGFPVYVLLHGGKFSHGSACDFGRPGLVHNFVRKGIIVVTLNYRLGLYGFHKTGPTDVKSNRGLYDQKMALEWVRDNIKSFNGNPDKVTLGGFDSGACSAAMMTLVSQYDDSFDLFHNVILHASTADVCRKGGVFDQDVEITATTEELRENVTLHNELTARYKLGMQYEVPDGTYDKPILMAKEAMNAANMKKSVFMGLNLHEFVAFDKAMDRFYYNKTTKEDILKFFTEHVSIAGYKLGSKEARAKMNDGLAEALDYYTTINGTTFDSTRMIMEYVFMHNFMLLARDLSFLQNTVYIYRFDISPHPDLFFNSSLSIELLKNDNVTVPHGTDVRYAYLAQQYWKQLKNNTDKKLVAKEKKIGEKFSSELANFVKYGRPASNNSFIFSQEYGWNTAKFLKIVKINGSYSSSSEPISVLYEEEAFDLWERFAVFRETGNVTSPTEDTNSTTAVASTAPVDTSIAPVDTSTAPVDTSTAPVDTSIAPVDTSKAPVDTSIAPVDTSIAPVDTSITPDDTSNAPDGTSKVTTEIPNTTDVASKSTPLLPTTDRPTTKANLGEVVPNEPTAQLVNVDVDLVDNNR